MEIYILIFSVSFVLCLFTTMFMDLSDFSNKNILHTILVLIFVPLVMFTIDFLFSKVEKESTAYTASINNNTAVVATPYKVWNVNEELNQNIEDGTTVYEVKTINKFPIVFDTTKYSLSLEK